MAIARPLVTLVNIKKSIPGRVFETQMYEHIYDAQKAAGKMGDWILKDQIEKIESVKVNDGLGKKEVIIDDSEEKETQYFDKIEDNYDILDLAELQELCKKNKIKYHARNGEKKLIELLRGNNA